MSQICDKCKKEVGITVNCPIGKLCNPCLTYHSDRIDARLNLKKSFAKATEVLEKEEVLDVIKQLYNVVEIDALDVVELENDRLKEELKNLLLRFTNEQKRTF